MKDKVYNTGLICHKSYCHYLNLRWLSKCFNTLKTHVETIGTWAKCTGGT